jgi:hypothetical protein
MRYRSGLRAERGQVRFMSQNDLARGPKRMTVPPQFDPSGMREFLVFGPQGGPLMKRKRYSEEKIVSILKEHEYPPSVSDIRSAATGGRET